MEGDRYGSLLLQVALALAMVATFAFSFSAFYSDCLIVDVYAGDARRADLHRQRSELTLGFGSACFSLVPVLSLFALGLVVVGALGAALWCGYAVFANVERRRSRAGRVLPQASL